MIPTVVIFHGTWLMLHFDRYTFYTTVGTITNVLFVIAWRS